MESNFTLASLASKLELAEDHLRAIQVTSRLQTSPPEMALTHDAVSIIMEHVEAQSKSKYPDLCLGKVEFYDDIKNHFGIINNLLSTTGPLSTSIKFYEDGAISNSFPNDCLVLFRLKEGKVKAVARDVVRLEKASYSRLVAAYQTLLVQSPICSSYILATPQFKTGVAMSRSLRERSMIAFQGLASDENLSKREISYVRSALIILGASNADLITFLKGQLIRSRPIIKGTISVLRRREQILDDTLKAQVIQGLLEEVTREKCTDLLELQSVLASLQWLQAKQDAIKEFASYCVNHVSTYYQQILIEKGGIQDAAFLGALVLHRMHNDAKGNIPLAESSLLLLRSHPTKATIYAALEAQLLTKKEEHSYKVVLAIYAQTGNHALLECIKMHTVPALTATCNEIAVMAKKLDVSISQRYIEESALLILSSSGLDTLGSVIAACSSAGINLSSKTVSQIARQQSRWSVDAFISYIRFLEANNALDEGATNISIYFDQGGFGMDQSKLYSILETLRHIGLIAQLCLNAWPNKLSSHQNYLYREILVNHIELSEHISDELLGTLTSTFNSDFLTQGVKYDSVRLIYAVLSNADLTSPDSLHTLALWCQKNKKSAELCIGYCKKADAFAIDGSAKINLDYVCLFAWHGIEVQTIKSLIQKADDHRREYLIKYLLYRIHVRGRGIGVLQDILSDLSFTTISIELISFFVLRTRNSNDNLLGLLNSFIYKQFSSNHTSEYDSFKNLFAIKKLSRKCDGRKLDSDKLFKKWGQGEKSRVYIDRSQYRVKEYLNIFCEGRFWKSFAAFDSAENRPTTVQIHYCRGGACYEPNMAPNLEEDFSQWTIVDILTVLSYPTDHIVISAIAGWANRMNEILEHLQCRVCKSALRPKIVDFDTLGHYAVPIFYCLNDTCEKYRAEVRFTHCIKCHGLIDSRDCESCSNKWLICNQCEACCPEHTGKSHTVIKVQRNTDLPF